MRNCIKWLGFGALLLLLLVIAGVLLWQGQSQLADRLLARYLPDLHYAQVTLDSTHGRLALRGVKMRFPGVVVDGGDVEIAINPATLLRGPIGLKTLTLRGLKVKISPEGLSSFSVAASDDILLPQKVIVHDAVVTVLQNGLPHLRPLHVDGEANPHTEGWSFQSIVKLSHGVVRTDGNVVGAMAQGHLQADGVTIAALLQQLGVERGRGGAGLDPQGDVDGILAWKFPLSAPDTVQVKGDVRLYGVVVTAQQRQQQIGDVAVKLSWQGERSLLRLHQVEVRKLHLRWSQDLSRGDANVDVLGAVPELHWQLDQLRVVDGVVDLDVTTIAGKAVLPVRLERLDLRDVTWKDGWPTQGRMQATIAKGKLDLSLHGHEIVLNVHGVSLFALEPLLISATGLRTPKGALGLRLRGSIAPRLKLFGELTMDHLVLAPRIPVAGVDLSIPYKLGLRALTDDNGITRIPLAIRGTVDNPDVDIAQIVAEVKKNLFNGGLNGGFKYFSIDFLARRQANQQGLTPTGEKKLAQLVRILQENRRLRLSVRGCVGDKLALAPLRAQKLALARVKMVRSILKHRLQRDVVEAVIYPTLTKPSPDIEGKDDRVEVSLYPRD